MTDRYGNVIYEHEQPSDSFVWQFLVGLYVLMSDSYSQVWDTDGNGVYLSGQNTSYAHWAFSLAASGATKGLVVGSSGASVGIQQYAMQSLITDGSGEGQLSYGAQSFPVAPTIVYGEDEVTGKFEVQRVFTNNSGSGVSVRESGIYCQFPKYPSYSGYFMIVRDNFSQIIVSNGSTLTVTYRIIIELPVII